MGFGVPLSAWFRGALRTFLWDHLNSTAFAGRGIASPAFVRQMLREHDSGRRDNSHWLWSLLMLELWFCQLEAQPAAALHCL
jgi:asparagine synthase (glutamine-hydrolysing)